MKMRITALVLTLICSVLSGCQLPLFGAQVVTATTDATPPGNVRVHVSVEDEGEPIGYLEESHFSIYENELLLNSDAIDFRLLPFDEVATGASVVLLDLSQSPSRAELTKISRGAAHFVETVSVTQAVTILAFDGSERVVEVAHFPQVANREKRALPDLTAFLSSDPSRDLNSAVLAAIETLAQRLQSQKNKIQFGNVITLVRGPDLAGRKTDDELKAAIADSGFEYFSLSPDAMSFPTLGPIGRDKRFTYMTMDTLPLRFQDLAMRVRAAWESHYLLSYCTPARAGTRKLTVRVRFENEKGKVRKSKSKSSFDANGFQGGCLESPTPALETIIHEPIADELPPELPTAEPESPAPPPPKRRHPNRARGKKIAPPVDQAANRDSVEENTVVAPPTSGKYE